MQIFIEIAISDASTLFLDVDLGTYYIHIKYWMQINLTWIVLVALSGETVDNDRLELTHKTHEHMQIKRIDKFYQIS